MKPFRAATLATCALAFATVAVLPALVSMSRSPGFPVQVFTVDDGLYLQRAIGAWQGLDPYAWSYFENTAKRPLAEVALLRPNAVVDIAAGGVAHLLGLSPAGLAVFLDWTCGALSFALFLAIFRRWTDTWVACGAAILAVSFPGALIPEPLVLLPNAALPMLVNQPFIDHASPAFRAVYTQVSYPFFLLAVWMMVRHFLGESRSRMGLLAAGILSGLVGYGYFFPWLALLLIGPGMAALTVVAMEGRAPGATDEGASGATDRRAAGATDRRASGATEHAPVATGRAFFARIASDKMTFFAGWILGSLGVFYIMAMNETAGIVSADVLGRFWFFPIERLLLSAVLLGLAWRGRRDNLRRAKLLAFLGYLLAIEPMLMNVQPVLRQGLAPYHFPGFYLHPFVTGGFFLLLVDWLRSAMSLKLVAQVVCALPLLSFTFDTALGVRKAFASLPIADDLGWLVERLQATPSNTVFALSPIRKPFSAKSATEASLLNLPNFVSTLSGRHVFHQEWMFNELGDDSDLRRELGTSWLLSGTMRPLWTPASPVSLPGDVFTLTWTYLELRREQKLDMHRALLREYTPCRFLSDFRVDLLVHDPANDGPLAAPESRYLEIEAISPNETFGVYRFDRARAAAELCRPGLPD